MKLTEYMFDKYKIPALFIVKDPVLTAFSCGRSTALILDCGHKQTIATPVNDGYALLKCILKHEIGGSTLTQDLQNFLLNKKSINIKPRHIFKKKFINVEGSEMMQLVDLSDTPDAKNTHPNYNTWCKTEIVREMKEEFLSISDELLQQKLSDNARINSYELPDGTQVSMSAYERQSISEKLFIPLQESSKFPGIPHQIVHSISSADIDIRRDLFSSIILSGGTTMMKGFQERVQKQLPDISP